MIRKKRLRPVISKNLQKKVHSKTVKKKTKKRGCGCGRKKRIKK